MRTVVTTEIGYCTADRIYVRGRDLAAELIGKVDFIDMMMLVVLGRMSIANERDMLNAILVTVMDHGLTPSALAARLTYLGAPEASQAAVAAGLLGAGSVFLGAMENASLLLRDLVREAGSPGARDKTAIAMEIVGRYRAERRRIFGIGHNIHRNGDPRVPVLWDISRRCGFAGPHWEMLEALEKASAAGGEPRLRINAAGAVGAMVADMNLPIAMARGLALIGRCTGLVAHIVEEQNAPIGQALWNLVLSQDPRNVIDE